MDIRFNIERAKEIGLKFGKNRNLPEIFMKNDPQYKAVENIYAQLGLRDGLLYVVGISLISYMLSTRGEEHWGTAALYATRGYPEGLLEFVEKSPSTALYRRAKYLRVRKYLRLAAPILARRLTEGIIEPQNIPLILANALGTKADTKTLVFAAKMAYYFYKAAGIQVNPPSTPIPVDYRVSLVTLTSGIATSKAMDLRKAAREIRSRYRKNVIEAWNTVSSTAGIPPALLDNIIWVAGRCIDEHLGKPQEIPRCLEKAVPEAKCYMDVLSELWSAVGGLR